MNPSSVRRRTLLLGVVLPSILLVAGIVVMLWALPDQPDPAAVHWGPSGLPDGFGSPLISLVLLPLVGLGYLVLPALVTARIRDSGPTLNQRILLAAGPFVIGLLSTLLAGSFVIQRGLEDAREGPSILPTLAIALGVAVTGGIATWFLLPPSPEPDVVPDAANLPARLLASDERVVWIRRVAPGSPALGIVLMGSAVALVGLGALVAVTQPVALFVLVIPLIVIILGYGALFWTLTVDRHGVLARGGFGSWPVIRIPLAEIQSARVIQVDPLADFGGWGMRWAPKTTGLILRRGEALEVTRTDGRALVATLDYAQVGAELLNALVLRERERDGRGASGAVD